MKPSASRPGRCPPENDSSEPRPGRTQRSTVETETVSQVIDLPRAEQAPSKKKPRNPRAVIKESSLDPEAYLNIHQACQFAGGITRKTLYRWMKDGIFPRADRQIGQANFWQRKSLVAWANGPKQAPAEA